MIVKLPCTNQIIIVRKKGSASFLLALLGILFIYFQFYPNDDSPIEAYTQNTTIDLSRTNETLYMLHSIGPLDMHEQEKPVDINMPILISNSTEAIQSIRVSGFHFCSILNDALFNISVHICKF